MDKFDRFQLLHRILRSRQYPVSTATLAEKLECSERTIKRIIDAMRDFLEAPIEYVQSGKGWHYANKNKDIFELPGLWLTSHELQSLATLLNLLEHFGHGLFNQELQVIETYINKRLAAHGIERSTFDKRIRVLPLNNRYISGNTFALVCEALLKKRQLTVRYTNYQNKQSKRTVSPQRLVHYRENWYLDAWCHRREALRTFSLARFDRLMLTRDATLEIPDETLTEYFSSSYGIFSGMPENSARLRFFPKIAREISLQNWHPQQQGEWQQGDYLLTIPYSDERELTQDIIRHVPNVYVEAPASLRETVALKLAQGLEIFSRQRAEVEA